MLIITALSLLGALLIQVPGGIAEDPNLYGQWVDTVAGNKVGDWAPFLSALRLFDVFHSPWFIIAGAILILNILVCNINRWNTIRSSLRGSVIKQSQGFYSGSDTCVGLSTGMLSNEEAAGITERLMKARGYRVRSTSSKTAVYQAGDKNRLFRLGTYVHHLSLILFILAFITGNYFGFKDSDFTVPEGSVRAVGHDTNLFLELTSFVDEYYQNGRPKDYRSDVTLYENGQVVATDTIRVNHPLIYNGIRFYQSYFGPAVTLRVNDSNGRELFNDGVALEQTLVTQGYLHYEGFFDLSETDLSIRIIKSGSSYGSPMIPPGHVAVDIRMGNNQINLKLLDLGVSQIVSGLEFTYLEETQYSGFQVSHDPTNSLIWIASTLFVLGICAVLYFPYRQFWVRVETRENNQGRLAIRISGSRRSAMAQELQMLVTKIEKEISKQME